MQTNTCYLGKVGLLVLVALVSADSVQFSVSSCPFGSLIFFGAEEPFTVYVELADDSTSRRAEGGTNSVNPSVLGH
jgi:hypothetical protein